MNFRSIISYLLILLQILLGVGYGLKEDIPNEPNEPVEIINDIAGDSSMDKTILYAKEVSNKPQGYYSDAARSSHILTNSQMSFEHNLTGNKKATLSSKDGKIFLEDTFDVFYTRSGKTYYASESSVKGRVNTIRLGEYYYDCHVRDFDFGLLSSRLFKVDKNYHLYGDKLYQQISLLASEPTTELDGFGIEIKIPAKNVLRIRCKTADSYIDNQTSFKTSKAEYVAFDIKDAGIVGFIIPSDGSTSSVELSKKMSCYTLRINASFVPGTGINAFDETGGYELNSATFGHRIWTDGSHSFDEIEKAAYLERNPLTDITVTGTNANAVFVDYEYLRGTYKFVIDGTHFNAAFAAPDMQYFADIKITSDNNDRNIYVRSNGKNGCLEASAILDDTDTLIPVNVQVCKNFGGDGGEPFYSIKDYQYGDAIYPLSLRANQTLEYKMLNLYQNWGKHPLKQLSSIEFHVSYYHLSTGVTETNCIAPYFVFEKDGWTLPDFRGFSSEFWTTQPQHNSVGRLYFPSYNYLGQTVRSEYTDAFIRSSGLTYSDMDYNYISDCGSYKYTLRHVEMPQTDENRTYYTLDITFLRDISFQNFKRDFSLFSFDGRMVRFEKACYLDKNNQPVVKELNLKKKFTEYIDLGSECPYWGYLDITDEDVESQVKKHFGSDFALIVKNNYITSQGNIWNGGFTFKNKWDGEVNTGTLTLNAKRIDFSAGDKITVNFILLPWGFGDEETPDNVLKVREDSALKPFTASASVGNVIEDEYIPTVKCVDNKTEFSITGGRNACAVRLSGFTTMTMPRILMSKNGGEYSELELSSSNGYDGYTVYYNEDGTYDFSFVYTSDGPDSVYNFKVG